MKNWQGKNNPHFNDNVMKLYAEHRGAYNSWRGAKERCYNKNHVAYPRYGGKGIKMSDDWLGSDGFRNFLRDMGDRPSGKSLDRIDPSGDYCKENCRWSTYSEQALNKLTYKPGVPFRRVPLEKICPMCHKKFQKKWRKFCSIECAMASRAPYREKDGRFGKQA